MARRRHIGIVGAGPAGIMAALEAASRGARVSLFDTNAIVGRKLLVTGNGRCNISNQRADPGSYSCGDRRFVAACLGRFGPPEALARLAELGIPTHATPDGWCYPLSNSAASVAQALAVAVELAGIAFHAKTKISDIRPRAGGIRLVAGGGEQGQVFERVIVACGGKAYPALGSKGQLLPVLERLGHRILPIYPALAPITAEVKDFHRLQGVRLDVGLRLYRGQCLLGETFGNLMFTQFGFSGPAAMNLSHLLSAGASETLQLEIDLLAEHAGQLDALIRRHRDSHMPLATALGAVLPAKIPPVLLGLTGLPPDARLSEVDDPSLAHLWDLLRHLRCQASGTRGFKYAQVSTGGIALDEVEPITMVSRLVPGLHFAGEVLDVVGPCGGYNLQWAWTSGALAGRAAAG